MCLLIVELLFFVAGASMLWSGKIPQGIFALLFGQKYIYEMEPSQTRKLGAWLVWPFPVGLIAAFGGALLFGEAATVAVSFAEPLIVIVVALVALGIVRQHRRPKLEAEQGKPSSL